MGGCLVHAARNSLNASPLAGRLSVRGAAGAQAAAAHQWHRQAQRRQSPAAAVPRAQHAKQALPLVALVAALLGVARAEGLLPHSSGAAVRLAPDAGVVPAWRGRAARVLPRPGLAPSAPLVLCLVFLLDQKEMVGRQRAALLVGGVQALHRE